ncbi:putative nuclease HARBI1 [Sinocyclocheilus grahami]|nr:PREDICTED: putative nuclease HARBI1 [Sinocyclocheilus grahami]
MVHGDLFGVHKSTVSRIDGRVSQAIAALKNQYIRFAPTGETSAGFYRRAGFPGVIGAIDCTHIPIQNPGGENGELFRNRKGYCSINIQVVCDEKAQITNIVARWPGSTHDSRIFDNSHLCALLESHAFQGHLVGDNGSPCCAYLLTPILNPSMPAEKRYNTCHIAARGLVERVFPCLQNGLRTKLDTTLAVIVALAVLYNFGKRLGDEVLPEFEVDYRIGNTEEEGEEHNAANANGNAVRRTLIENHFTA